MVGVVLANTVILGCAALAFVLAHAEPDVYYRLVQEDDLLEWATFWAFALAALMLARTALTRWRVDRRLDWFSAGVALFCALVAMEEISWGQRLLGFRPPEYFLEHNYQQELNVHNTLGKDLREAVLAGIILGFGVILPMLARLTPTRRLLERFGVWSPPLGLVPGFLACFALYVTYPVDYSGEWAEAMLGVSFLFTSLLRAERLAISETLGLVGAIVVALVLATGSTYLSRERRAAAPAAVEAAHTELAALREDFLALRPLTPCGLHKRVYTFVENRGHGGLYEGEFAALAQRGLPEARARYFLDPWDSPYWLRDECGDGGRRRRIDLYSTGPNRVRDSSDWELDGDDLGVVVFETGSAPAP